MFKGSPCNIENQVGNDQVMINNKQVARCSSFRCLGVEIDERMSWETIFTQYVKKLGPVLHGVIKTIKPFVPQETIQNLYDSLMLPYFDYCSPLWGNCGSSIKEKLQKLQNRAAKIIT